MKTITVYISAALLEVEHAADIAARLGALGYAHTSRWIDDAMRLQTVVDPTDAMERATILENNVDDIRRASACVFLAQQGAPRAGHWDAAFAHSIGKKVIWVHDGTKGRNVWDASAGVHLVSAGVNAHQTAIRIANALARELGSVRRTA